MTLCVCQGCILGWVWVGHDVGLKSVDKVKGSFWQELWKGHAANNAVASGWQGMLAEAGVIEDGVVLLERFDDPN